MLDRVSCILVFLIFSAACHGGVPKESTLIGVPIGESYSYVPEIYEMVNEDGEREKICGNCPVPFLVYKDLTLEVPIDLSEVHGFYKPKTLEEAVQIIQQSLPEEFLKEYFRSWVEHGYMANLGEPDMRKILSIAEMYTKIWYFDENDQLLIDMKNSCKRVNYSGNAENLTFDLALLKIFSEEMDLSESKWDFHEGTVDEDLKFVRYSSLCD